MHKILFVCTGNTCRSVMAEYLAKRRFGNSVDVQSAGIRPQSPENAGNAIWTLRNHFNLDVIGHIPRDIRSCRLEDFDYVVAMDNYVAKHLSNIHKSKLHVWKIEDPYGDDLDEYRRCALKISQKVSHLPNPSDSDQVN